MNIPGANEAFRLIEWVGTYIPQAKNNAKEIIIKEVHEMLPRTGMTFVRIAGVSGALSVALGAYGAHKYAPETSDPTLRRVFETGNKYHMLHSIALLAVPLTRKPNLVGTCMVTGMLLFSGSCYYHAFTGSTAIRKATPYGGMLLIAAWLFAAL